MQLEELNKKITKLEEDKKIIQDVIKQLDKINIKSISQGDLKLLRSSDVRILLQRNIAFINNEIMETLFTIYELQKGI